MYSGNFITFALHSVSDFGQTHMECILERCSSGLRGTPGKRVYDKIVSRVRIPISPHPKRKAAELARAAFSFRVQSPAAGGAGYRSAATKSRRDQSS